MITLEKLVGDVFPVEYNPIYNRFAYTVTAGDTDIELVIGEPVMDETTFIGFSLINGTIKATESAEIPVMNNGFGVVVKESMLPDSVTEAIKATAKTMGFKFLD